MADGTLRRIIEGTGQLCVAKLLGDVDGYSEELVNEALNGLQHGAAHRLQLCDIKWECWQTIPHHLSILCHPDDNKVADGAGECLRQYSVAEEQIVARGLIGDEANKLLHLLSHIVLSEKYPLPGVGHTSCHAAKRTQRIASRVRPSASTLAT